MYISSWSVVLEMVYKLRKHHMDWINFLFIAFRIHQCAPFQWITYYEFDASDDSDRLLYQYRYVIEIQYWNRGRGWIFFHFSEKLEIFNIHRVRSTYAYCLHDVAIAGNHKLMRGDDEKRNFLTKSIISYQHSTGRSGALRQMRS